jgi:hypothetical protein
MNSAYIISALSLALCIFFFFYFRSFLKRRTAAEELLAEYRSEVYRLIAEIDTATDRDSRLVEERIKTLKALLEDTDKRIAVYLREIDRSRTGEALYTSLGRGIRSALSPQPAAATPPSSQQSQEPQAAPVQPKAETANISAVAIPPKKKAASPAPNQFRSQVAALAAEGLSPAEIASKLGSSLSEVDLALHLLTMKAEKSSGNF